MFTFDIIGASLIFVAFFVEFTLILMHKPERKVVNDMMANFSLGVFIILAGLLDRCRRVLEAHRARCACTAVAGGEARS